MLALDMGDQVNIYELAERMIRLCGYQPHRDIEIKITGLRPGENLVEAMIGPQETAETLPDSSILGINPVRLPRQVLDDALDHLDSLSVAGDHTGARKALLKLAAPATDEPPGAAPFGGRSSSTTR